MKIKYVSTKKPAALERDPRTMELYSQGLCDQEIAEIIGATAAGVSKWRSRHGLPRHESPKGSRRASRKMPKVPAVAVEPKKQKSGSSLRTKTAGPDPNWKWWESWKPEGGLW